MFVGSESICKETRKVNKDLSLLVQPLLLVLAGSALILGVTPPNLPSPAFSGPALWLTLLRTRKPRRGDPRPNERFRLSQREGFSALCHYYLII